MACSDRYAGSCIEMECSEGWCRSSDWRPGCMSVGGINPYPSRTSLADAIRCYWLCLGSFDDARYVPVQNGKWPCPTREQLECQLRPSARNHRRRHDGNYGYSRHELRRHCAEDDHRSLRSEGDASGSRNCAQSEGVDAIARDLRGVVFCKCAAVSGSIDSTCRIPIPGTDVSLASRG